MNKSARAVSLIALVATIVPSMLFFLGILSHDVVKWTALAGTVFWFVSTPVWMGRELPIDAAEVEI